MNVCIKDAAWTEKSLMLATSARWCGEFCLGLVQLRPIRLAERNWHRIRQIQEDAASLVFSFAGL
jgi:hypothetical protein